MAKRNSSLCYGIFMYLLSLMVCIEIIILAGKDKQFQTFIRFGMDLMRVSSSYSKDRRQLKGLNEDELRDLEMNSSGARKYSNQKLERLRIE